MGNKMKAYQAYAAGGFCVTRSSARLAAVAFFEGFPTKRKCNVSEGVVDGDFFYVTYKAGATPERWVDVTKKTLHTLPL